MQKRGLQATEQNAASAWLKEPVEGREFQDSLGPKSPNCSSSFHPAIGPQGAIAQDPASGGASCAGDSHLCTAASAVAVRLLIEVQPGPMPAFLAKHLLLYFNYPVM